MSSQSLKPLMLVYFIFMVFGYLLWGKIFFYSFIGLMPLFGLILYANVKKQSDYIGSQPHVALVTLSFGALRPLA